MLSGDLDEYAIAALRAEPVDSYGVGTSVVTGSGRADRGDGLQAGRGGRAAGGQAQRVEGVARRAQVARCAGYKPTGTAIEEVVHPRGAARPRSARTTG